MVYGLEFKVEGLGLGVWDLRFGVEGLGFRVKEEVLGQMV
jgi:hypothetical protein